MDPAHELLLIIIALPDGKANLLERVHEVGFPTPKEPAG